MSEIELAFRPGFKDALLTGAKTLTSRTSAHGAVGDTFRAFGATFQIFAVSRAELWTVADRWREEGCGSREEFVRIWVSIHPRRGYNPSERVWIHEFRRIA